jgi:hypothetical protein
MEFAKKNEPILAKTEDLKPPKKNLINFKFLQTNAKQSI